MTRRRSSYRSLASLQRDVRVCRACVDAGYDLESLPVVNEHLGQRAYVYGQAPGIVEGVARVVGNAAHSATRVFRPRYKVVEVDTDRGSVVVKEQRWSWRRWRWEVVS